jgi:hypothetical protein
MSIHVHNCPFCEYVDVEIDEVGVAEFAVTCNECRCIGPIAGDIMSAIAAWNNAPRNYLNTKVESMPHLAIPPLTEGEIYIGAIGDSSGNLHHVILLPGDNDDATFEDQMSWAESIGGDLPTRIEQAMLYANHKNLFKKTLYWSNETYYSGSGCAWYQSFFNGYQYDTYESYELRARAVRRLVIE